MLHQDYLVRVFMVLAAAIRRTILNTSGEKDPEASAELLESTLSNATEIDGSLLLKMDPETMVSMLQISNTDPTLVGYISRTLLLESSYLRQAQRFSRAELREEQALSLARAYGFSLSEEDISPEALESFFAESLPENIKSGTESCK